jgi:hypothetical protein
MFGTRLSPRRPLDLVQPTVALHRACFALCNATLGCGKRIFMYGDNVVPNTTLKLVVFIRMVENRLLSRRCPEHAGGKQSI